MKSLLVLAAAFVLTAAAAQAQTVAPGTTPGAQTGNPSNMPSAGSPSTDQQRPDSKRMENRRMMHKSGKMKTSSDNSKMKTKM